MAHTMSTSPHTPPAAPPPGPSVPPVPVPPCTPPHHPEEHPIMDWLMRVASEYRQAILALLGVAAVYGAYQYHEWDVRRRIENTGIQYRLMETPMSAITVPAQMGVTPAGQLSIKLPAEGVIIDSTHVPRPAQVRATTEPYEGFDGVVTVKGTIFVQNAQRQYVQYEITPINAR
ncbi:hypothetical protein HYV58_00375, partial [Candidatus Peregrinibacteria bacterium]|nr:hypothetical protein [Candidatus Peregrinibacteria bacterium]